MTGADCWCHQRQGLLQELAEHRRRVPALVARTTQLHDELDECQAALAATVEADALVPDGALWRVRWHRPGWTNANQAQGRAWNSRIYATEHGARRLANKMLDAPPNEYGRLIVEVHRTDRGPWIEVAP